MSTAPGLEAAGSLAMQSPRNSVRHPFLCRCPAQLGRRPTRTTSKPHVLSAVLTSLLDTRAPTLEQLLLACLAAKVGACNGTSSQREPRLAR